MVKDTWGEWSHFPVARDLTAGEFLEVWLEFQRLRYGQGAQPRHIQKYGKKMKKI
jgi:hypothetical protein